MRKVELNKERKKNDLLNAAYKLFTTIGFSETTITQIASKAKVGKGTFYLYFKSKEDINRALIAQKSDQLLHQAIEALNESCKEAVQPPSICEKIIFITDYIVTEFSKDIALLRYISKYLSRGLFSLPGRSKAAGNLILSEPSEPGALRSATHGSRQASAPFNLSDGSDDPSIEEPVVEGFDFRDYILSMLEKDGVKIKNFDLMLFTIIELINSTCYNVILHGEPVTFSDYKPYLFNCVRLIVNEALAESSLDFCPGGR